MAMIAPEESTTVRTHAVGTKRSRSSSRLRALRAGLSWLSPRAPRLATRIAEDIFRTPPRPSVREAEIDALVLADPVEARLGTERIPAWRFGEGPAVVLVHGWGGRAMQLRGFIEPLVSRGYSVVLFDAPGHGASGAARSSLPEVAAATRAVFDAVGRVHAAIAHSMGGPATLLAMQSGRRPARLALLAPPSAMSHVTHRFARFLRLPEEVRVGLERTLERRFLMRFSDLDVLPIARAMPEPLLVVHDRGDRDVPFEEGAALARAASAELFETRGLGHNALLRDSSVIERVVDFVDR